QCSRYEYQPVKTTESRWLAGGVGRASGRGGSELRVNPVPRADATVASAPGTGLAAASPTSWGENSRKVRHTLRKIMFIVQRKTPEVWTSVSESFDAKEMGTFSVLIVAIAAGVVFAVGAGMCAVIFIFHRLCQGTQRHENNNQRTTHAEPEDKEDELVMIDNVVYSGRRALPSPPYEEIAECLPPPTVKCSVEVKVAAEVDYAEVELD
ncbi:hypothetical protein BaRGS_00038935, partial [Batillaria attramentaria]